MFDKQIILDKLKYQFENRNIVGQLILINIVLFLIGVLLNIFGFIIGQDFLGGNLSQEWLYVPSRFKEFIYIPYTLISYQFLHEGFFHLFSNMLIVYFFGNTFIQLTHKKKILPLYLLGGIFSGLIYLSMYNLVPSLSSQSIYLVGASGSAMAILAAVATIIPEREIYLFGQFKIKYKWIAIFFFIINLIALQNLGKASSLAHLGGLLFGFLFVKASNEGINMSKPVNDVVNYLLSFFIKENKPKVTFINEKFKNKKQYQSKKIDKNKEEKINAILDKIRIGGYDKLSKAEKDFLFNNSKK